MAWAQNNVRLERQSLCLKSKHPRTPAITLTVNIVAATATFLLALPTTAVLAYLEIARQASYTETLVQSLKTTTKSLEYSTGHCMRISAPQSMSNLHVLLV